MIAAEALHYLLRDESISPRVFGLLLPNADEILNVQFADDTSILFELTQENMHHLIAKLDLFCIALGSKISIAKSIIMGWEPNPP